MKAILFDVDDTLYDQVQPLKAAYKFILQTPIDLEKLLSLNTKYSGILFEKARRQKTPLKQLYIERAKSCMSEFGIEISDEQATLYQERYIQAQKEIQVSNTIEELLNFCIKKGIFLGIITNGLSDHQREKIETLNLERWIKKENILVSSDVGVEKPNAKIFHCARQKMQLEALPLDDIWYVGDSFQNDITGSKKAGWKAIWYNRRNEKPTCQDIIPDYIVKTDEELFRLVKKIINERPLDHHV